MILLNDIDRVIEDGDEVRDYPESHHWVEDEKRLGEYWNSLVFHLKNPIYTRRKYRSINSGIR